MLGGNLTVDVLPYLTQSRFQGISKPICFSGMGAAFIGKNVSFQTPELRRQISAVPGIVIDGNVTIGAGVSIGPFSRVVAYGDKSIYLGYTRIGSYVSIEARKKDVLIADLAGQEIEIGHGAFVKDVKLTEMGVIEADSEVKNVTSCGAFRVGTGAFWKDETIEDKFAITELYSFSRRENGKIIVIGERINSGLLSFISQRQIENELRAGQRTAHKIIETAEAEENGFLSRDEIECLAGDGKIQIAGEDPTYLRIGRRVGFNNGKPPTLYPGFFAGGLGTIVIHDSTFLPGTVIVAQRENDSVYIHGGNTFFPNSLVFAAPLSWRLDPSWNKDIFTYFGRGNGKNEIGIGGGTLIVNSQVGHSFWAVRGPVLIGASLGDNVRVFGSLVMNTPSSPVHDGEEDDEIDIKGGSVVYGETVTGTVPENSRLITLEE